ncbi:hypothetical protein NA57DRAFT_40022 [Rhizodiscina lignyota]|uniref:Phytochrome n=1 Tax=Rhizodiscina lignyota TaxID=1504668 RepID=A0A9P4IGY4_9PEZI|nr:hypothetical protein NA57DRAFT_40022 [Rhizodiscina lignyota]
MADHTQGSQDPQNIDIPPSSQVQDKAKGSLSSSPTPFTWESTTRLTGADPRDSGRLPLPTPLLAHQLSPGATDRVFPIRSVMSVNPTPAPAATPSYERQDSYFYNPARAQDARRQSRSDSSHGGIIPGSGQSSSERAPEETAASARTIKRPNAPGLPAQVFSDIVSKGSTDSDPGDRRLSTGGFSTKSARSSIEDSGLLTTRFKHVTTEDGHHIITGRGGEPLQRCEDEPIHIPGAVQGFGLLVGLQEESEGKLVVRIVSENSRRIIGYSPKQLFALDSFTDILTEEQSDNLMDHLDFIRDEDMDIDTSGPEVFTMSITAPNRPRSTKLWCAIHTCPTNPDIVICEFELEDDHINPLLPPGELTPELPEDTLSSDPTTEELEESTKNISKPLRVLRGARKRKGEAAAMEVFNIMAQVQEQLASAPNLETFLKVLVGVVKELTGFHRVMIYQFDQAWNGRVVTELVDPRATKDLYKGLNFPASDIPKQARDMYKLNRVRLLYDRDQETARLVCRTVEDLETPLDLTYSYLRAMSPIHLKYLANMAVRSSMSISINAFDELWGLISCHTYGPKGMRVSFPIRKLCRIVGDSASRNIERLSYASRLQARKLINTVPTKANPSGYIIASSEDLLKLFDADLGLLAIRDETKIFGSVDSSQEALVLLEYLRMRKLTSVLSSQDIAQDFPDLRYPPGFQVIVGLLLVPLSVSGNDFIVFFRKGQLREVKWAGNPYEKVIREGTEGYLEPRGSFKLWSETVIGKCREWKEEEIETAAVLCLVYGKFIEVWRQKEAALQSSQLTRLLLANSAHEVRTPLNAIINYLEIALESALDEDTRENLAKSHSASKSLIYVINDLLDLTKTEEGADLIKGENFDFKATLSEATQPFQGDARRKGISYEVIEAQGLPTNVIGDQRKVRQAITNITANAIQNTQEGGVKVEAYVAVREEKKAFVEVAVQDTGVGMSDSTLDLLFRDLEQVQSESTDTLEQTLSMNTKTIDDENGKSKKRTLGLGLAIVARIVRNMNGQLRLKSEEGNGSRFIVQFPFLLPDNEPQDPITRETTEGSITPGAEAQQGEVTLVDRDSKRPDSASMGMVRKTSNDSVNSRKSLRSFRSAQSGHSDVDRLIGDLQAPHMVHSRRPSMGERSESATNAGNRRSKGSITSQPHSPSMSMHRSKSKSLEELNSRQGCPTGNAGAQSEDVINHPGEQLLPNMSTPIKPVRVPEEENAGTALDAIPRRPSAGFVAGEISGAGDRSPAGTDSSGTHVRVDSMNVLVAEDDPINSKIIKKRLEKLGHEIHLTVNGQECATAYQEKAGWFDVVLMDMQMPIVDGLTSTKLIRSHEKAHPHHSLSARAALNGRVPIIAVSASLVEKERQTYIDAGFDGWILKPISFSRLSELMAGIVDEKTREDALYQPGEWEKGGWFMKAQPDAWAVDTKPSEDRPAGGAREVAEAEGSQARASDAGDDPISEEQERLRKRQEEGKIEPPPENPGSKEATAP